MAFEKSYPSPHSTTPASEAYWRIVDLYACFLDSWGKVTLHVYQDKASRDAGKYPLGQVVIFLSKEGENPKNAVGIQLVKQGESWYDPNNLQAPVVPTYPAFPGFEQILSSLVTLQAHVGKTVFDVTRASLYQLLKTRPEFAGSKDV